MGPRATRKRLEFSLTGFTWDGKSVVIPSNADLASVFGKPDRVAKKGNDIWTWDALGLYAILEPRTKILLALIVELKTSGIDFAPASVFASEFGTPWGAFGPMTNRKDVEALGFTAGYSDTNVKRDEGAVSCYLELRPELASFQMCRAE